MQFFPALWTAALAMLVPPHVATAEASTTTISVYDGSSTYTYHGCYSGTTTGSSRRTERGVAGTAGDPDGGSGAVTKVSLAGEMTVPKCLDLCSRESEQYRYVRLQSARWVVFLLRFHPLFAFFFVLRTGKRGDGKKEAEPTRNVC